MNVYFETLGCPKNMTDSEHAAGILENNGYRIAFSPEDADVIVINTCGFIQDAKEESIETIFDMLAYQESGKKIVVSGCLAQRYKSDLIKEIPEADLIIGVDEYENLPSLLMERFACNANDIDKDHNANNIDNNHNANNADSHNANIEQVSSKEHCFSKERKALSNPYTSYLKISEGCNNICTYCVIPSIRGKYRSRDKHEIIEEAKFLASEGCKELVVVAQDVTAYGMDFDGEFHLPELLQDLCKIEGIEWIRLMYCYEDRITDELIKTIASEKKICHYLDMPIQHCSDTVLAAMNRRSSKKSITDTVKKLRAAIPDIHIRTTIITGFPGETKEDFEELAAFISEMKFDRLGVFHYSKEEGTPAAKMKNQVRKDVKLKRKDILMNLQREISLENNQKKVGLDFDVIVDEETDEEKVYLGRTRYDGIDIDNGVVIKGKKEHQPGDIIHVKITDAFDYDLFGEEI